MSRWVGSLGWAALSGFVVLISAGAAGAQTAPATPPPVKSRVCWINAANGRPVPPEDIFPGGAQHDPSDPNHASIPKNGTYVRTPDGGWINAANGRPVPDDDLFPGGAQHDPSDPHHASIPGEATFVRVPCPTPKGPTRTLFPDRPPFLRMEYPPSINNYIPENGQVFGWGIIRADYGHFGANSGPDGDQAGVSGSGVVGVTPTVKVQIDAGYHDVVSTGPHLDNWTVGGTGLFSVGPLQFGPAIGFQSNSKGDYSADTTSYGGFIEYRSRPTLPVRWLVHGEGGGFTSQGGTDGDYVGGGGLIYPTPNVAIDAGIDYTKFVTHYGNSDETDYTIGVEYLLPIHTPISVHGGYTRSDFSPGSFHVDTFSVGIKFYFNGGAALADKQAVGVLPFSTSLSALELKF